MTKHTNFRIEQPVASTLKIIFSGRLDIDSVAELWSSCVNSIQSSPKLLILDFKDVDYCDGAGIALIQVLQKRQITHNNICKINNLKPSFASLLEYIERQPDSAEQKLSLIHISEPTRPY